MSHELVINEATRSCCGLPPSLCQCGQTDGLLEEEYLEDDDLEDEEDYLVSDPDLGGYTPFHPELADPQPVQNAHQGGILGSLNPQGPWGQPQGLGILPHLAGPYPTGNAAFSPGDGDLDILEAPPVMELIANERRAALFGGREAQPAPHQGPVVNQGYGPVDDTYDILPCPGDLGW